MKTAPKLTFTFVVEFRGGTYCSQVQAKNLDMATVAWIEKLKTEKFEIKLLGHKTINEIIVRIKDKDCKPVQLADLVNVWFNSIPTKQGNLFINIIQTDTST